MSEFNELLKDPKDPKTQKMDAIFAPAMSPSWSKHSQVNKDNKDKNKASESKSFKEKIKNIFS